MREDSRSGKLRRREREKQIHLVKDLEDWRGLLDIQVAISGRW